MLYVDIRLTFGGFLQSQNKHTDSSREMPYSCSVRSRLVYCLPLDGITPSPGQLGVILDQDQLRTAFTGSPLFVKDDEIRSQGQTGANSPPGSGHS